MYDEKTVSDVCRRHDDHSETSLDIPQWHADFFGRHPSRRHSVGHWWPGTGLRAGNGMEYGRDA